MQLTRMKCEQAVIRVKFRVDFIIILIDVFRIHILIKLTRRKFTKNSPYLLCCVFLSVQLINFIDIVFFFWNKKCQSILLMIRLYLILFICILKWYSHFFHYTLYDVLTVSIDKFNIGKPNGMCILDDL